MDKISKRLGTPFKGQFRGYDKKDPCDCGCRCNCCGGGDEI